MPWNETFCVGKTFHFWVRQTTVMDQCSLHSRFMAAMFFFRCYEGAVFTWSSHPENSDDCCYHQAHRFSLLHGINLRFLTILIGSMVVRSCCAPRPPLLAQQHRLLHVGGWAGDLLSALVITIDGQRRSDALLALLCNLRSCCKRRRKSSWSHDEVMLYDSVLGTGTLVTLARFGLDEAPTDVLVRRTTPGMNRELLHPSRRAVSRTILLRATEIRTSSWLLVIRFGETESFAWQNCSMCRTWAKPTFWCAGWTAPCPDSEAMQATDLNCEPIEALPQATLQHAQRCLIQLLKFWCCGSSVSRT